MSLCRKLGFSLAQQLLPNRLEIGVGAVKFGGSS